MSNIIGTALNSDHKMVVVTSKIKLAAKAETSSRPTDRYRKPAEDQQKEYNTLQRKSVEDLQNSKRGSVEETDKPNFKHGQQHVSRQQRIV